VWDRSMRRLDGVIDRCLATFCGQSARRDELRERKGAAVPGG